MYETFPTGQDSYGTVPDAFLSDFAFPRFVTFTARLPLYSIISVSIPSAGSSIAFVASCLFSGDGPKLVPGLYANESLPSEPRWMFWLVTVGPKIGASRYRRSLSLSVIRSFTTLYPLPTPFYFFFFLSLLFSQPLRYFPRFDHTPGTVVDSPSEIRRVLRAGVHVREEGGRVDSPVPVSSFGNEHLNYRSVRDIHLRASGGYITVFHAAGSRATRAHRAFFDQQTPPAAREPLLFAPSSVVHAFLFGSFPYGGIRS